jgi:hypothetical protein
MNRYITDADKFEFEKFLAPNELEPKLGIDYVFDSPAHGSTTIPPPDGRIWLTQIEKQLPKLQDGSTIWFHASKLQNYQCIILTNETLQRPWPWKNISFRPIPDAQLYMKHGPLSYGGTLFKISGILNPTFKFDSKQFGGFDNVPENLVYTQDNFGLVLDTDSQFLDKGHALVIHGLDGGYHNLSGFAGGGGNFTLLRHYSKINGNILGEIDNVFGYRTGSEPFYIGNTDEPPFAGFKDWKVGRVLVDGSGTESWQRQHSRGNSKTSKIYIVNADTKVYNNFQNWQNGAVQEAVDEGVHEVDHLFIDGFGAVGITLHTGAPYTMPDGSIIQPNPGDRFVINNAYIYGGHNPLYVHNSCSRGITWEIKNLWVGGMNDDFANTTDSPKNDFYLNHAGTDRVIIGKLIHDGSRPKITNNNSKFQIGDIIENKTNFPRPKYKYPNYKWIDYSEFIADYYPNPNGERRTYKKDQYVMDREVGTPTVFLKTLQDNISTSVRPKNNPALFQVITWDSNGYPSDDARWNSGLPQRSYPPVNFAHTYDSPLKDFFFNAPAIPVDPKDELIEELQAQNDLLNTQLIWANSLTEEYRVKLVSAIAENETLKSKIDQAKQFINAL